MDTDRLRTIVASLVFEGDLQELMHLYSADQVSLGPDDLARLYAVESLPADQRPAFEEVRVAIPAELLPSLDARTTAPAELMELTGRCAAERGEFVLATKAFREVSALDKYRQLYSDFALESLVAANYDQAAFELVLAGRLGWALRSNEERLGFLLGLGIDANELAYSLGAERSRGRFSGGRALPEFPAFQTYGPLFHATCAAGGCVARRGPAETVPLAIRFLIHDEELAQRALAQVGDQALRLLQALAREVDPDLAEYAARHPRALERFRRLQAESEARREEEPADEPAPAPEAADSPPDDEPEKEAEAPDTAEEEAEQPPDELDQLRQGLEEVQALLLGRPEKTWRNCLAELAAFHPTSLFTVCTVRAGSLGSYVIPVEEMGPAFLAQVTGDG